MQVSDSVNQSMKGNMCSFHRTHMADGRAVGISARDYVFRSVSANTCLRVVFCRISTPA
jgi:hypothetical protein